MPFTVAAAVYGRARKEVNDTAKHVGTVLRTVRTAQDFDRFQRRRFDQTEERPDTATLRAGRVAHAVNKDSDVAAGQAAHENRAQRWRSALKVHTRLFVNNLGDNFGRAIENGFFGQ